MAQVENTPRDNAPDPNLEPNPGDIGPDGKPTGRDRNFEAAKKAAEEAAKNAPKLPVFSYSPTPAS